MHTMVPTIPDTTRSLAGLLPDCLAALAGKASRFGLRTVRSAVVVVVDGLGAANLRERAAHARHLASRTVKPLVSAVPSTTAASLTTLLTGAQPGRHGIVGYRALDPRNDRVVNQLTGWDALMVPETWQRVPTAFESAAASGIRPIAVGPRKFAGSGFSRAVLRGADYRGEDRIDRRFDLAAASVSSGPPTFVYLYVPELDKIAHRYGWSADRWVASLETVDGLVRDLERRMPKDVGLVVTADHGIIDAPYESQVLFDLEPSLVAGVRHVGGEPRFLHLYTEPGADPGVLADSWRDANGDVAWTATRDEAIAAGWFGDVEDEVLPRIGNVLVAARGRATFYESGPEAAASRRMIGQHGSLTDEERRVPFIRAAAWAA